MRLTSLCALGAVVTTFTLAACSDSFEPRSTGEPAEFQLGSIGRSAERLTVCHVSGGEGRARYQTLNLPVQLVYGRAGHLNTDGTPRRGHERDFIVTADKTCPPTPVTTGTLYICKIAGEGVAVGSTFSFTVNGTPITATATTDAGSNLTPTVCANAGTFTPGTIVVVREAIAAGFKISTMGFGSGVGAELITFDQAPGTQDWIGMTVKIGVGQQFGIFTNAAT